MIRCLAKFDHASGKIQWKLLEVGWPSLNPFRWDFSFFVRIHRKISNRKMLWPQQSGQPFVNFLSSFRQSIMTSKPLIRHFRVEVNKTLIKMSKTLSSFFRHDPRQTTESENVHGTRETSQIPIFQWIFTLTWRHKLPPAKRHTWRHSHVQETWIVV